MSSLLSASIICADLLNLESVLKELDELQVDMFHVDVGDTSFTHTTMLPVALIPMIKEVSSTPLDIHLMLRNAEDVFTEILPYCENSFVTMHVESTSNLPDAIKQIKERGGRPGVALNPYTPISCVNEVISLVDQVLLLTNDAGRYVSDPVYSALLNRIKMIKKLSDLQGIDDIIIAVDGGVTKTLISKAIARGANSFVLGSSSIFTYRKLCKDSFWDIRSLLQKQRP